MKLSYKQSTKVISLTFLFTLLLTSCTPPSPIPMLSEIQTSQPSNFPGLSDSVTVLPTLTASITPVPTKATPTFETKTPIYEKCVTVSPDWEFTGGAKALLFDRILPVQAMNNLSILRLKDEEKIVLKNVYFPIATSPDSQKFAYINQKNQLLISDSDGEILEILQGTVNWTGVVAWMNDETILIQSMLIENGKIYPPASILRYDTKTEDKFEYIPDYPDIAPLAGGVPNWGVNSFTLTVYNYRFSRVVYPAWNNDDDGPVILMDIENKREILRLHGNDFDYGGGPVWLKDDSAFLVAVFPVYKSWREKTYFNFTDNIPYKGGYELALISLDGKVKRLTYLTREFIAGEEGISLSPNNTKVAFWLNLNYTPADRNASRQLAILDIPSGEITNLCIPGGDFPYPPVWSPDENFLLVTVSNAIRNESNVYVIDLENSKAKMIAGNAIAVGWLIK